MDALRTSREDLFVLVELYSCMVPFSSPFHKAAFFLDRRIPRMQRDPGDLVSLNETALRGGLLLDNVSSVFGGNAFLSIDDLDDGQSITEALKKALNQHLTRVIDLFHEWDANGDGFISKGEFRRGLAMILDRVPSQQDANSLFDSFDADGSEQIEYKELRRLLRGLGPRGPRKPLWEPKRNQHVDSTQRLAAEEVGAGRGNAITDAVKGGEKIDRGLSARPPAAALQALSYARSEAVLLGQLPARSATMSALARKSVAVLNGLDAKVAQMAEDDHRRLEERRRHRRQAEARIRRHRSEAAAIRQAADSTGARDDLSKTQAMGIRPPSHPLEKHRKVSLASLESLDRLVTHVSARPASTPAITGLSGGDLTGRATATALLPWAACNYANSMPGSPSALSGAFASSLSGSASAPSLGFPPNSTLSVYRRSGIHGYSSHDQQDASIYAAQQFPQAVRSTWPEDVQPPKMKPATVDAAGARSPFLVRPFSSHRPSTFVSSLRSPSGVAAMQVPVLPRPKLAEAGRAGLYNLPPDESKIAEKLAHRKFRRKSLAPPDEIARQRAELISSWLEARMENVVETDKKPIATRSQRAGGNKPSIPSAGRSRGNLRGVEGTGMTRADHHDDDDDDEEQRGTELKP